MGVKRGVVFIKFIALQKKHVRFYTQPRASTDAHEHNKRQDETYNNDNLYDCNE
jgi:hypothetical protein